MIPFPKKSTPRAEALKIGVLLAGMFLLFRLGGTNVPTAEDLAPVEIDTTINNPIEPSQWRTVLDVDGQSKKDTKLFEIKDKGRIKWQFKTTDADSNGHATLFQALLWKQGSLIAETVTSYANEADGTDETYIDQPGVYYLEVISFDCEWDVAVEEYR